MRRETPMYLKIAARVREQIADGTYPIGTELPSRREMMALFPASGATIRHALDRLEREGLINVSQGRRAFVIAQHSGTRVLPMPQTREQLLASLKTLAALCQEWSDTVKTVGLLTPETLHELPHVAVEVQILADRLWQQHERNSSSPTQATTSPHPIG